MATLPQLESKYQQLVQQASDLESQASVADLRRQATRSEARVAAESVKLADPSDPVYSSLVRQAEQFNVAAQAANKEVKDLQAQRGRVLSEASKIASEITAIEREQSTIKTPTATNESQTDRTTSDKYADGTRVPQPSSADGTASGTIPTVDLTSGSAGGQIQSSGSGSGTTENGTNRVTQSDEKYSSSDSATNSRIPASLRSQVNGGTPPAKSAQWSGAKDMRVTLRVPSSYLIGPAAGPAGLLKELGGILFPYTPEIGYENTAHYSSVNPVHSNYTQFYYKHSSVGPISVTGKFTVQNEKEGMILLGIQHLLRSLTKMRFGSDKNAGSPPPVCRLDAYGDYMISNVPVVVSSFKLDLPNIVDYIAVKSDPYKTSLVPTISTISLTLNPMYSRGEISRFSVDSWLSGNLKNRGYL